MGDIVYHAGMEAQSLKRRLGGVTWRFAMEPRPQELVCEFFECGSSRCDAPRSFRHPAPPFNRLFLTAEGTMNIETAAEVLEVGPGSAVLLPARLPFRAEYRKGCAFFFLHFSLADAIGHGVFSGRRHPSVRDGVTGFPEGLFASPPAWDGRAAGLLWQEIFGFITEEEFTLLRRHRNLSGLLQRFFALAQEIPPAQLRVKEVCARLDTSCVTLARHFRREMGCTLREYLRRRLAERTLEALHPGHLPIVEAARRLGFEDPAYFFRFFRRQFGMTPGQWRRLHSQ